MAPSLEALAVPALPAGMPSRVPLDRALSLREAIAMGMYSQPSITLARSAMEAAAGRVRQAESGYFPALSVAAQHTSTGPGGGGAVGAVGGQFTAGGYTTNFSARELIYDSGKTPSAVGQARRQYDAAFQVYRQARQDLVLQVKQAYYTLLQDQELWGSSTRMSPTSRLIYRVSCVRVTPRLSTETLYGGCQPRLLCYRHNGNPRDALDLAKAPFFAGAAPRADVVRAEAAVAEAELNLATARNAAAWLDPATLVEQGFARRASVQQARADVEAAGDALRGARAGNHPSLSLTGNYGLSGSGFPPDSGSWAYGVSLQRPLLGVGLPRGRVQETEAGLLSAQARLRRAEQSVGAQVVETYLKVQTARQAVSAAQSEVGSAEESLRLATGRYEAGVATYVEVLGAEAAALTARTNLVNARYGLSSSLPALQQALGMEEGEP